MPHFELGDPERELLLATLPGSTTWGCRWRRRTTTRRDRRLPGPPAAGLAGFWPDEVETIAQIVRFHRGKPPSAASHDLFARLKPWTQHVVEKLAAIVRTADALDRTRRQSVRSARLLPEGEDLVLVLAGQGDLRPELEALKDKGRFLFKLLDRPVRIVVA